VYRVEVDLVQLAVAVTDRGGDYARGLKAEDFRIYEDGIPQKISSFSEVQQLSETQHAGSSVFVLFDTSNIMYPGLVYAQDAITDFLRNLDQHDSIAVYSFSRNLLRACPLTSNREMALMRVRQVVAGDDTSLFNAMALTLEDAIRVPGQKTLVVFSNGPDNSSSTSPEAIGELAANHGIPIYIVSTQDAGRDRFTAEAFQRLTGRTGGKAYFAETWRRQLEAFDAVRQDLKHLYVIGYYPALNKNMGWRKISVELVGEKTDKFRIRTRAGYRPRSRPSNVQVTSGSSPDSPPPASGDTVPPK